MLYFHSKLNTIEWDRIYLFLEIFIDNELSIDTKSLHFYLVNSSGTVETELIVLEYIDSCAKVKLNVTNSGVDRCINNDVYKILITDEMNYYSFVEYREDPNYLISNCRCWRYGNNVGAYTVTFNVDEYDALSSLQLCFFNTNKVGLGNMPARYGGKPTPLIDKIKNKISNKIKKYKYRFAGKAYRFLKKIHINNSNEVLFFSAQDDELAHNMEVILKRIQERHLDEKFNLSVYLKKMTSEQISLCSHLKALWLIAKANVIFVDDHVPYFDRILLKDTKVIQVWHAGAGFKGVGYSRWGHHGCPGPFSCHRQYTYCVSGSKQISHFFSEQFGVLDEQVIPTGMPRMDEYLDTGNRKKVTEYLYEAYPFLKNKNVVLFAPTYRGQNRKNAYYPYEIIDFQALYEYCKRSNSIVLFKMHPWVASEVPIDSQYSDCFYDFNKYPDINELFYITDLLITDYSSSMYEYALMNKPMLAFAYDKYQYSMTRGFHRSYDDNVPGKVCESFSDLLAALENEDFEYYKHDDYMLRHYDHTDTGNTDRVIDWLLLDKIPDEYKRKLDDKLSHVNVVRNKNFSFLMESRGE